MNRQTTAVFVSLTLDLSDLHVVGASVNVDWMSELKIWFQTQLG